MKVEDEVLWVGFQAEGTGAKVKLGVAKDEAREGGKGLEHRGPGTPSCGRLLTFIFYRILVLNLLKKR